MFPRDFPITRRRGADIKVHWGKGTYRRPEHTQKLHAHANGDMQLALLA